LGDDELSPNPTRNIKKATKTQKTPRGKIGKLQKVMDFMRKQGKKRDVSDRFAPRRLGT